MSDMGETKQIEAGLAGIQFLMLLSSIHQCSTQ